MTTEQQPSETPIHKQLWRKLDEAKTDDEKEYCMLEIHASHLWMEQSLRKAKAELERAIEAHQGKCDCQRCRAYVVIMEALK